MTDTMEFVEYDCSLCKKRYIVNVAHTFDPCTPDKCHECYRAFRLGLLEAARVCEAVATIYTGTEALSARQCVDSIRALAEGK